MVKELTLRENKLGHLRKAASWTVSVEVSEPCLQRGWYVLTQS